MIPLYDENPRSSFPFINYLLIAANILMFLTQMGAPDPEQFVYANGFIPSLFNPFDGASYQRILTSMFMHGGLLHIASNMIFLHVFGDNVEDRLGHIRYLLFYLAAGVAAAFTQFLVNTGSDIPMIGASGAVAGVAGAYFVWFSNSKIRTLVPVLGFISFMDISAGFMLGYWFLTQLLSGLGTFAIAEQGGIAFFAHIGGFAFGYLMARAFRPAATISA